MATRAEWFRYYEERSHKKPEAKARPRKETPAPHEGTTRLHPESRHADAKAAYALEDSRARPSRRSTRKASNRQRTDVKSRELQQVAKGAPQRRPAARRPR